MLLDSWRLAVGTLTAFPVRPPGVVDRPRAGVAMAVAPLAVEPLAAALVTVALVGHRLGLPSLVVALLALGSAISGNRAFHLDGLSDTVDGLAASYDRERSLAVMKSGTAGPAGVVAVVLVVGLEAAALASLVGTWRGAVVAGIALCSSRGALAACCVRGVPSARPGGLGDTYTQTVPRIVAALLWVVIGGVLAAVGAWAGLPWWRGLLAAALALLVVAALVVKVVRRFGGVTGDVFGAAIELALATMLVALA